MSRDRIQHQPCGSDELATCRASPGHPKPSSTIDAGPHPFAKAQCLFFRPEVRLLAREEGHMSPKARRQQLQVGILAESRMIKNLERDERIILSMHYQGWHLDAVQEAI